MVIAIQRLTAFVAIIHIFLPASPPAIICIPMTSSAIPNTRDAKTAPYKGDAIISPETATAMPPATTLNPLDPTLPCLSPIPRMIPAIPTNNSATAIRSSRKTGVPTGNDRNIDEDNY